MKNYKHLNLAKEDVYDNVLTKNLPSVSLRNPLTTNIILSMESFLKVAFDKVVYHTKYFSH